MVEFQFTPSLLTQRSDSGGQRL